MKHEQLRQGDFERFELARLGRLRNHVLRPAPPGAWQSGVGRLSTGRRRPEPADAIGRRGPKLKQPQTGPRYKPPIPAIRAGSSDHADVETRFASLLTWYMRALALFWMGQGVFHWAAILLPSWEDGDLFDSVSFLGGAAVIFFCVLDLIAAVGLWLASAWGGVVWLVVVAAQWLVLAVLPRLFPYDRALGAADVLLVAGYFYLTYRAAREAEPFV